MIFSFIALISDEKHSAISFAFSRRFKNFPALFISATVLKTAVKKLLWENPAPALSPAAPYLVPAGQPINSSSALER
jgi:hypothetical protein